MQVFKGSSFWAVGLFGLLASVVLSFVALATPVHAAGESYSHDPNNNTITVSGGILQEPAVLTPSGGANSTTETFEGVIMVSPNPGRQDTGDIQTLPCYYNFRLTPSGNNGNTIDNGDTYTFEVTSNAIAPTQNPDTCIGGSGLGGGLLGNTIESNLVGSLGGTKEVTISQNAVAPPTCPDGYTLTTDQTNCIGQPNADGQCDNGGTLVEFPAGSGRSRCEIAPTASGTGADPTEEVQCTTESGLSWLLCPALEIVMNFNDTAAGLIDGLLEVSPLEAGGDNAIIFEVWSNLRNIANIFLIFALFAIIFSQATSAGISAYGIKRIVPRLVAGAVLINLSFFLCSIAIDIFNVLGFGIRDLLVSALQVPIGTQDPAASEPGLVRGIGFVFATAGVLGAIVVAVLFFSGTILLALLVALATLAVRQAAIIILVILSPIAFAAWILPNTDKIFDRWKDLFISLLIMFPLVMLIFAGARVAATVIGNAAGNDPLQYIIAIMIAVLPAAAIPLLFKVAGGFMGRLYGALSGNKLARGAGSGIDSLGRKPTIDALKRGGRNLEANMRENKWGYDADGNPKGTRRAKVQRRLANGVLGKVTTAAGGFRADIKRSQEEQDANARRIQQIGTTERMVRDDDYALSAAGAGGKEGMQRAQARATAELQKVRNEEIDQQARRMRSQGLDFNELERIVSSATATGTERAAAGDILMTSGATGVDQFRRGLNSAIDSGATRGNKEASRALIEAMERNQATLDRSSPDLADFSRKGDKAVNMLAAERSAAGTRTTSATVAQEGEMGTHYGFSGKNAEQIITYTPATSYLAANAGDNSIKASEAEIALKSRNIGSAKPVTRQNIESVAGRHLDEGFIGPVPPPTAPKTLTDPLPPPPPRP